MNNQIPQDEWDAVYSNVNKIFNEDKNFSLMNHGFFPIHGGVDNESLLKSQESLYLYAYEAGLFFKNINSLLEVGSGRGGGLNKLKEYYNIPNVYGCDYNRDNIYYSSQLFPDIEFSVCDAQNLNYDRKFDAILNIESSHCYPNLQNFFEGVYNNLEDDGIFIYADIFDDSRLEYAKELLQNKFDQVYYQDISLNVISSCAYTQGVFDRLTDVSEKHRMLYNIAKNSYTDYIEKGFKFIIIVLSKTIDTAE